MRRAIWLIVVLTIIGVGGGLCADFTQRATARRYLADVAAMRESVLADQQQTASDALAGLRARWGRDEEWLNCLISHHHTRAVATAMTKLETALAQGWRDEALRALDELTDALGDVEVSDYPLWENIL